MTEGHLDPYVRSLLEDKLAERDLDMALTERMLERAQHLEGDELDQELRALLQED